MVLGTLLIFSGLPASGKSTLASKLASKINAFYLRIDTIEQALKDVCNITVAGEGYELAYRIAQDNLRLGLSVIADAVNPWLLTRTAWETVATSVGATFINIEIVCSDSNEHQQRVETRRSTVPGLKLPTWHEVQQRDYHPWHNDRIVIDTSAKTEEACLDELIQSISASKS